MFTVLQGLSFGLNNRSAQAATNDLPVIRTPLLGTEPPQLEPKRDYGSLSEIFGEMVDDQKNSLSKW